jgi:hypothetical protein
VEVDSGIGRGTTIALSGHDGGWVFVDTAAGCGTAARGDLVGCGFPNSEELGAVVDSQEGVRAREAAALGKAGGVALGTPITANDAMEVTGPEQQRQHRVISPIR